MKSIQYFIDNYDQHAEFVDNQTFIHYYYCPDCEENWYIYKVNNKPNTHYTLLNRPKLYDKKKCPQCVKGRTEPELVVMRAHKQYIRDAYKKTVTINTLMRQFELLTPYMDADKQLLYAKMIDKVRRIDFKRKLKLKQ